MLLIRYQRSVADGGLVAGAVTRDVVGPVGFVTAGAVGVLVVTASLLDGLSTVAITRYPGNASGYPERL